jgi:hypothetical protein
VWVPDPALVMSMQLVPELAHAAAFASEVATL